jgi:hypothetical protein
MLMAKWDQKPRLPPSEDAWQVRRSRRTILVPFFTLRSLASDV